MRTILLCSSDYLAIPAALKLQDASMLSAVVVPDIYRDRLLPSFIKSGISTEIIHSVTKTRLEAELAGIIASQRAELACVITFPWKIPSTVIALPPNGFLNFHPGILPDYRGADPIFWQLKNREVNGGFSIHFMTDVIDEGPVLCIEQMPVIQGETYGIHLCRLGVKAAEVILKVIEMAKSRTAVFELSNTLPAPYFKKPERPDVTIKWKEQTASEIEALINACNPRYNGALTRIREIELTLMEVEFADLANGPRDAQPGTIVYADNLYGLIVACIEGGFLKINIVNTPEGYITGAKLFRMGYGIGDAFY